MKGENRPILSIAAPLSTCEYQKPIPRDPKTRVRSRIVRLFAHLWLHDMGYVRGPSRGKRLRIEEQQTSEELDHDV